ncbi:MAG TPA: CoA transferase [Stellaceae bacterium]|nr:CoA transferase [Stellaceae bacterium]
MTAQPFGALAGIRVIDLSRVLAGPYCTQVLGDHGAEVIKIEPPQGDETRGWGPPFRDGDASYFIGVNRNKRVVSLDLAHPKGREVLLRLLEDADVLVENFKTGTLEKWRLGYESVLAPRFPGLIHCRVSGFGADGPFGGKVGYDAVAQAMSGLMSINGLPEGDPLRLGTPVADLATGLNATIGILLALIERGRSGKGQFVEATLYDSGIALLHPHLANFLMSGKTPGRTGNAHPNIAPYDCFETANGAIFLGVGNDRQFARFCDKIGAPVLAADPRFLTNGDRSRNRVPLRAELEALLAKVDGRAFADELLNEGVPCGPVLNIPEVAAHPHTLHREMIVESGEYRGFGVPVKLSRTPGGVASTPRPFGADTRELLAAAGYDPGTVDTLIDEGIAFDRRKTD